MNPQKIDGNLFKLIITNGTINLKNNHQVINDLNVFPVPDGDTGSNMQSTMMSGVQSIQDLNDEPIEKHGKALSRGLLMGARGNSGVILSQLFSGFAKAFNELTEATTKQFIEGLKYGVKQAYGAVINPVEGTILTVAREAADKAASVVQDDTGLLDIMEIYLEEANASLKRTPDLLPVLKESGVVDSGGAGLIVIVEGIVAALKGEVYIEDKVKKQKGKSPEYDKQDVEFGYCTEFIIQLKKGKKFNRDKLVKQLGRLGDSIVVVADEEICKVHVHTETPGDALNIGQIYGEFANLKIENMTLQHTETLLHSASEEDDCGHDHHQHIEKELEELETRTASAPIRQDFKVETRKKFGLITVVNGRGLKRMFEEMGVDFIIDGGQTMNPATEDFIDAIEEVNADNIIIIPNNKNVFLSAETAAKTVEDKSVIVLPAKTIAQGYASLTMFDANQPLEEAVEEMKELINHVKSGEITYAVRDTEVNGLKIKKGDYLGIQDGKIVLSEKERVAAMTNLIDELLDEDSEIITVMYGEEIEETELQKITEYIEEKYSDVEIEVVDGQQAIYDYLIAVE